MKQYIELNLGIQGSLIIDFDKETALSSAYEDWKIDIEGDRVDKNVAPDDPIIYEDMTIDYEGLSEFFFDLCLSWCQYLDAETFLFFINGVFLNITSGAHISVSTFKNLEDI